MPVLSEHLKIKMATLNGKTRYISVISFKCLASPKKESSELQSKTLNLFQNICVFFFVFTFLSIQFWYSVKPYTD